MIRTLTAAVAAAMLAILPLAAPAAISAGTEFTGTLDQGLDSGSATVGEGFTMSNVHSTDNKITGATIYGHVADVVKAGQGRPGKISLAFDRIVTRSGNSYALSGRATGVSENTKSNATKEVVGGVVGMVVGNYIGKHVGTNIGGLLGAAGGYLYAKNNRANVTIPQNSAVTMQVIRARRQAGA